MSERDICGYANTDKSECGSIGRFSPYGDTEKEIKSGNGSESTSVDADITLGFDAPRITRDDNPTLKNRAEKEVGVGNNPQIPLIAYDSSFIDADITLGFNAPRITRDGKPIFENCGVHFSLSHSGAVAVVAMGYRPCGVDVERIRAIKRDNFKFMGTFENDTDFFREWVKREARVKYTGAGLSALRTATLEPPGTRTVLLPCYKGYALALCM
ncbi:MAG: hypothetical protein LBC13_02335 [Clostridiales bacterium]|nr:hypothetical protein [Clostridiales bacterium]